MQSEKLPLQIVLVLLVLVVGSQAYFFVSLHNLKTSGAVNPNGLPPAPAPSAGTASSTSVANIVVGNEQVAYQGTITQLGSGTMQVKTAERNVVFTLSSDTKFFIQDMQKSSAEYNQEMIAYNARVTELMKDPQKNAEILKTMNVPSTFTRKSLTLSDFKVGDNVFVTPGSKNSDGSFTAVSVSPAVQ